MRKVKLVCPYCDYSWEIGYLKWLFTSPFHMFDFLQWKDYRKTICPNCGEKHWADRK